MNYLNNYSIELGEMKHDQVYEGNRYELILTDDNKDYYKNI
jgi:hypothetical protein